jgi:hypothetical protein
MEEDENKLSEVLYLDGQSGNQELCLTKII